MDIHDGVVDGKRRDRHRLLRPPQRSHRSKHRRQCQHVTIGVGGVRCKRTHEQVAKRKIEIVHGGTDTAIRHCVDVVVEIDIGVTA